MDLYFKRHDGQAVTCEDFFASMRDANNADFANFLLWLVMLIPELLQIFHWLLEDVWPQVDNCKRYSQAGTPIVKVSSSYDVEKHTFALKFRYICQ